jgi:hypothetical protein
MKIILILLVFLAGCSKQPKPLVVDVNKFYPIDSPEWLEKRRLEDAAWRQQQPFKIRERERAERENRREHIDSSFQPNHYWETDWYKREHGLPEKSEEKDAELRAERKQYERLHFQAEKYMGIPQRNGELP